jgi:hypothetical protein
MQPPMRDTEHEGDEAPVPDAAPATGAAPAPDVTLAPDAARAPDVASVQDAAPATGAARAQEVISEPDGLIRPAGGPSQGAPAIRASDRERDAATNRLQEAFAEGRLDDTEFDVRMRAALTAPTRGDLEALLTDLPDSLPGTRGRQVTPVTGRPPGRFAITYKNSVRRAGRWRVPERYTAVVYKGTGWLDLRAAELTSPVTTIMAVAYKSRVTILVPPGVRVEVSGFGATTGGEDDAVLPPDAPVVHVRGYAYKGTVETRNRPPEY